MTWERVRATIGVGISALLVVSALTVLNECMRAVMSIGGSCGTAGTGLAPCPGNTAGLLPAAIWGGLIFLGLYVWQTAKHDVPSFVSLVWPALFISLGWNFLDYGIRGGVVSAGSLVCGVVFVLMGGIPLIWALPHLWRVYALGHIDADKPWHVTATGNAFKAVTRIGRSPSEDMADSLERLDRLHKSGGLDDLEYAKAKDKVIREGKS